MVFNLVDCNLDRSFSKPYGLSACEINCQAQLLLNFFNALVSIIIGLNCDMTVIQTFLSFSETYVFSFP